MLTSADFKAFRADKKAALEKRASSEAAAKEARLAQDEARRANRAAAASAELFDELTFYDGASDAGSDDTGVPTPENVAQNNRLDAMLLVTDATKPVARACFFLARAVPGENVPAERDAWFLNTNNPGEPDTGMPTLDRLDAVATAFSLARIDCGVRTCEFKTRDDLTALGESAQEYAIPKFGRSLLKSALKEKEKEKDLSDAELDRRVTPERVASVITFGVRSSGARREWHVDTTAAAWREMGITAADVFDRIKFVSKMAWENGIMARV